MKDLGIHICASPRNLFHDKDATRFSLVAHGRLDFRPIKNPTQGGLTCAGSSLPAFVNAVADSDRQYKFELKLVATTASK